MRNTNITRLDSKGRILIPAHIRKRIGAGEGTEMVIVPDNENRHAKILPLVNGKTAEFRLLINDAPGSLARIANIFVDYNIDIIMSQSRCVMKGKLAEWDIIADVSECNGNINQLKNALMSSDLVRSIDLVKK